MEHPCLLTNTGACLAATTYLRATRTPKTAQHSLEQEARVLRAAIPHSPDWSGPTGLARCLHFISSLQEDGYDTDQFLNEHEMLQLQALTSVVRDQLAPAVLYYQWLDNQNYDLVTAPEVRRMVGFPRSLIKPQRFRAHVAKEVLASFSFAGSGLDSTERSQDTSLIEAVAYRLGRQAIETIADRYRKCNGPFFFGNRLTSIDCLLYGYLAVLRGNSWVNTELQELLKTNLILSRYIDAVHELVYPNRELPSRMVDLGYENSKKMQERNQNYKQVFTASFVVVSLMMILGTTFELPRPAFMKAKKEEKVSEAPEVTAL